MNICIHQDNTSSNCIIGFPNIKKKKNFPVIPSECNPTESDILHCEMSYFYI